MHSIETLRKELLHRIKDGGASPRFVDRLAQCPTAGHAVREPGGELLHLAGALAAGLSRFEVLLVRPCRVPVAFFEQHGEVGADHAIAVPFGRDVVPARGGVLRDLAEDPGVCGRGAANHHGVTASARHHGNGVFGCANVSVADHRDRDCVLYGGNVLPAGVARVALLPRAGVQRDCIQSALLRKTSERDADDVVVVPP